MAFEIDIGYVSLAGIKPVNEDFCAAMLPAAGKEGFGAICAIADGVSTGGKGKEAAQTTVMSLVSDYFGTRETWDTTVALDRVIMAQNAWLLGLNRKRASSQQCGLTTLTALVLRGQTYTVAHAGDSRAYLLRDGSLTQLTTDHVMQHPDFKHQLLRAVGAEESLVVDYSQGDLQVGDVFVLLTDGVHNFVSDRQLRIHLAQLGVQDSAESIVRHALDKGGNDNASAIVVRALGLQQSHLRDEERVARSLPIPQKMRLGQLLDGLTITSLVSDSGVNLLYQARDTETGKLYAVKALHPSRQADEKERDMLAHEAWLAKRMQSSRAGDHLVHLHERLPSGAKPESFYLLYDWHSGETLEQALQARGVFGIPQAVQAAIHVLRALGVLHRQGVIHRDIKPANLHLAQDGVVRLLDLGVALSGHEPAAMRQLHAGTPSYINPEQFGYSLKAQAQAQPADAGSDLYALGVSLYQLLTGKLPYGEVLPYQTGRYYRDPTPPSRINAQVPVWLDHVVLKAVARDQKLRFETAEEFVLALERGASRPLSALPASPLLSRDSAALWKIGLWISVLLNFLLVIWLLFLPKS
jgi:serine/threonine protein phosphatase PrpC